MRYLAAMAFKASGPIKGLRKGLHQERVDRFDVIDRQLPGGRLQFNRLNQGVVLCAAQVSLCGAELLLRIEHIDVDSNPHLVSRFV